MDVKRISNVNLYSKMLHSKNIYKSQIISDPISCFYIIQIYIKCIDNLNTYFNKNKLLKGFRHIVQTEKEDFLLQKEFQNGLRQLGKFKLTYDLLILPNQINAAIKLVSLFPDQVFILDHLAKPKFSKPLESNWVNQIKILAKNVYGTFSFCEDCNVYHINFTNLFLSLTSQLISVPSAIPCRISS